MPEKSSLYAVKKHSRQHKVQTAVYIKCRCNYTLFPIDYQYIRC